ncbi:MAG: PEGA domain-containing protein [Methanoregula sp.]|nr:PEGA domain-containing protein [Methanoregula sp.]
MRSLYLLLLFCLLLAGPVAAASVNLSAAPPVAKVIATPVTVVSLAPQRTLVYQSPLVTPPPSGILEIVSEPPGASVFVDRLYKGTTPFSKEIPAGSHTVNVTLAGYRDYSSLVAIPAYGLLSVTIGLERIPLEIAHQGETLSTIPATATMPVPGFLNLSTQPNGATITLDGAATGKVTPSTLTLVPGTHIIRLSLDGYRDYTMNVNVQSGNTYTIIQMLEPGQNLRQVSPRPTFAAAREVITPGVAQGFNLPSVSTDEANTNMCLSGQKCLALHEAAAQYPQGGYYYLVDGPACGHVTLSNGTAVPRYCISVPAGSGIQAGRVPAMVTIPAAQPVNAVNASALQAIVTPRVLGGKKQAGAFDSVLGFFNGLFGGPVCLPGQTACGSRCVNLTSDSLNCGSCDYTCFDPAVCSGGECVDSNAGLWTPPIPL